MPDDTIGQALASLDKTFNTNQDFGFQGMIKAADNMNNQLQSLNQQAQQSPLSNPPSVEQAINGQLGAGQFQAAPPAPVIAPAPQVAPPPAIPDPAQYMAPLNDSIQSLRSDFTQTTSELANMRSAIQDLRGLAASTPPGADGTNPIEDRLAKMEASYTNVRKANVLNQARQSLESVKQKYPDADLSENDLSTLWQGNRLDSNLDVAESVRWNEHWDMLARSKSFNKTQEKLRALEQENSQLKTNRPSQLDQMSSVPRTANRQQFGANGLPQEQLFPGAQSMDDAIYAKAKELMGGDDRQKGKFMGWGNAVAQARKLIGSQYGV